MPPLKDQPLIVLPILHRPRQCSAWPSLTALYHADDPVQSKSNLVASFVFRRYVGGRSELATAYLRLPAATCFAPRGAEGGTGRGDGAYVRLQLLLYFINVTLVRG